MIIISDSIVLSAEEIAQGINGNNPRIGWHNLVTQDNAFADEEDPDHPVQNLGNPATYLYWKSFSSDTQTVGVSLDDADTVNYMALARHNLGSGGIQYTIQSSVDGNTWDDLSVPRVLPNDNALIHEFEDTFASHFRIHLEAGGAIPEIGVLYAGRILRLQRRIYVGHTPLTYGRSSKVNNNFSEDGQFLGRTVQSRMYQSAITQQNITADFYRDSIDPFFHEAIESPFFVAWRPEDYPTETGYVWLTGDPSMSNQRPNGMVNIEFSFQGIR